MTPDAETVDALSPPTVCANNLHRVADLAGDVPEPTLLCRNELGVVHMLDCPLALGLPCTYFAPAEGAPEPVTDAAVAAAGAELRRDFLGWAYTRRVRALGKPRGSLPDARAVEAIAEPDREVADLRDLLLRPPPDGLEAPAEEPVEAPAEDEPPVAEEEDRGPELYPGQRRSEERARRRREGRRARAAGDDDEEDGEPPRARTVEELLEELPEAPLPDRPARRRGGRSRRRGRGSGGKSRGRRPAARPDGETKGPDKGTARPTSRRRRRRPATGGKDARPGGGTPQRSEQGGSEPRRSRRRRRRGRRPRGGGGPSAGSSKG